MYTVAALLDVHSRVHRSLAGLFEHCRGFSDDDFGRSFEGFGYSSMREQFDHVVGAEAYWTDVLRGVEHVDGGLAESATITRLEQERETVAARTRELIEATPEAEWNVARPMTMWGGKTQELVPALVLLRPLTHVFHHMGQIAAMCRLLGRPVPPGLDLPIK